MVHQVQLVTECLPSFFLATFTLMGKCFLISEISCIIYKNVIQYKCKEHSVTECLPDLSQRHCPKRRCHFFISITNNSNKNKAIFTRINTHILYGLFFMDIEPPFLFNQVPLIYFESRYARCTSCSILTL